MLNISDKPSLPSPSINNNIIDYYLISNILIQISYITNPYSQNSQYQLHTALFQCLKLKYIINKLHLIHIQQQIF